MFPRIGCLMVVLAIANLGCERQGAARGDKAKSQVLVLHATYPGASALEVAVNVAAPLEKQIKGIKNLVRIESKSNNDGSYVARLYFESNTDSKSLAQLVNDMVARTAPTLPADVGSIKVSIEPRKTEVDRRDVAIAVIDREASGLETLRKLADSMVERLKVENALIKPVIFPPQEKQISLVLDRQKCLELGVSLSEVHKALKMAGEGEKIESLKKLVVQGKITIGEVATLKESMTPAAIYRINLSSAILISGAPPEGKTVDIATAKCIELIVLEMNRQVVRGFAVEAIPRR